MQPADDDACAAQPSSSPSWWSRTMLIARDSLAGTVGAFAKVMSGHPLDTLKVRMQTSTQRTALAPSATIGATLNAVAGISSPLGSFSTLSGAARLTWRTEGISGFYRGLSPTLPGVFMYNAALFAAYGQFELAAIQYNATRQASIECNDGRRGALPSVSMLPSVAQIGLIGAACGAVVGVIVTPVELLRCRLQASRTPFAYQALAAHQPAPHSLDSRSILPSPPRSHHQLPQYANPLAVLRETLAIDGRRGLFKGLSLTLAREIPANALYFVTYETILRGAGFRDERERADASAWLLLLAGGLAGVANWLFVFPIDTIKSRYQTDSLRAPRYAGIWDCVRQTVDEGRRQSVSTATPISTAPSALAASSAVSAPTASASSQALGVVCTLFRGYSACLGRAFVANAATFGAVELVHRWLPRREIK